MRPALDAGIWFRANKLSLNISRTKRMLFCRSPPRGNEELILTISNTIIQRMKCLQFLGHHIDEKLDWHLARTHQQMQK